MFEDFLKLSYWKETHKLRKLREMINRIDVPSLDNKLTDINLVLTNLTTTVNAIEKKIDEIPEELEPEPTDLPDLIVESIDAVDKGHYWDFAITVKNIGNATAPASTLNAVIPDVSNVNLSIPTLIVGASATVHTQVSYDPDSEEEQYRTIIATADATNSIPETTDFNNTKQIQILLKGQQAPPLGKAGLIVHIHNPEGNEIGGLMYPFTLNQLLPEVWIDGHYLTLGAYLESQHGNMDAFTPSGGFEPGIKSIGVRFNGIILPPININLEADTTTELIFVIPRIEYTFNFNYNLDFSFSGSLTSVDTIPPTLHYADGINPSGIPWDGHALVVCDVSTPTPIEQLIASVHSFSYLLSPSGYIYNYQVDHTGFSGHGLSNLRFTVGFDNDPSDKKLSISPIPIQSTFNTWIMQTNITGKYPKVTAWTEDESVSKILVPWTPSSYAVEGNQLYIDLPTDISYTKLGFRMTTIDNIYQDYYNVTTLPPGTLSSSGASQVEFKMSSIPYDMEGTAF